MLLRVMNISPSQKKKKQQQNKKRINAGLSSPSLLAVICLRQMKIPNEPGLSPNNGLIKASSCPAFSALFVVLDDEGFFPTLLEYVGLSGATEDAV